MGNYGLVARGNEDECRDVTASPSYINPTSGFAGT
jgi:hypothetical protein